MFYRQKSSQYYFFYDLGTGGFHNDILQISITRGHENSDEDLNVYILPTRSIDARVSNVNGMSVSYVSGKKQLVNRNKEVLPTISQVDATENVLTYLIGLLRATEASLLLIAHNGNSFDQPKLIAFLQKHGNYMDMHAPESKIFFGDSYQTSRRVLKDKLKRFTLGHVYQLAFDATFHAHNAYDNSKALADILMRSEYTVQLIEDLKLSCKPLSSFHQKQAQEKVTNSNISELR